MKFILENSNKYRRVKNALFGDKSGKIKSFAILSVENPLGYKYSTDEEFQKKFNLWSQNKSKYNRDMTTTVKKDFLKRQIEQTGEDTMKYGSFSYVQIKGMYDYHEKSFIVFNISYADAEAIARNYGQESFFFGKTSFTSDGTPKSNIAYYKTDNCCQTYKLVEITDTVVTLADAQNYFSKYGVQWRIAMGEFGDDVTPIENDGAFQESLDEDRPFMSRASHRRASYKKKDT